MVNAIGLQNMGVRPFIAEKLPKLRRMTKVPVIANVFGFTIEDCVEVIHALNDAPGIAMYELNASCPTPPTAAWSSAPIRRCSGSWRPAAKRPRIGH